MIKKITVGSWSSVRSILLKKKFFKTGIILGNDVKFVSVLGTLFASLIPIKKTGKKTWAMAKFCTNFKLSGEVSSEL